MWRLAPLGNLRLCVPGAIELTQGPAPAVVDAGAGVKTLKDALLRLSHGDGGSVSYRIPMVDAHLREDIAEECLTAAASPDWPLCVVGVTLGASLRLCVSSPSNGTSTSNASTQLPQLGGGGNGETPPVLVQCNGFQLQIMQRGGPPVDPAKLHGLSESDVAHELERWGRKALASRVSTWRTLFASLKQGVTEARGASPPPPSIEAQGCRQLGDVVLAVAADTEISLEPFELSYGDAHISSLRRMLEDEVANVLGIEAERVMCGEFGVKERGTRKRHVRRDTIMLRFALLNSELMELVKGQDLPKAQSTDDSSPKSLANTTSPKAADADPLSPQSRTSRSKEPRTPQSPSKSRNLAASRSEPTLRAAKADPAANKTILIDKGSESMPPDLLLKSLIKILADGKHPLRKHADAFPMLSRIVRGGVHAGAMLVANKDVIPGKLADGIRSLMRGRKTSKRETSLDNDTRLKLTQMRSEILTIYSAPNGALVAQRQHLITLSAKELLDETETSIPKPIDFQACLETLMEHTAKDIEWCLRLRSHRGLERIITLAKRFISDREVVKRCMVILDNLTGNDPGCVSSFLEHLQAPDLITVLDNHYQEHKIQVCGCKVLRRVYIQAREAATHGVRVITLAAPGKCLDEIWTFKGLRRMLETMRLFQKDAEIQLECCTTLASLGELLYNNGMAVDTFKVLEVVMRLHKNRSDILTKGILIIARLGPSFLATDHRGVKTIIEAMSYHRSCAELQRVGTKALFSLSRQEDALMICRAGGSVGAVLAAMSAHSKDEQVLREGTRALEKHAPRALERTVRAVGDLASVLPPVTWSTDPLDAFTASHFDLDGLKGGGQWASHLLDNFVSEIATRDQGEGDEQAREHGLRSIRMYRQAGLREALDAEDKMWAVAGASQVGAATRAPDSGGSDRLQGDIANLKRLCEERGFAGCETGHLLPSAPSSDHLKQLSEDLQEGLGERKYGAQDAELLASILGHFAWHSQTSAHELVQAGAAAACVTWLTEARITKKPNPDESGLAAPMHQACLEALSCFCRHDEEEAVAVLALGGARVAVRYADSDLHPGCQRAAMRLLARMISVTGRAQNDTQKIPVDKAWGLILRELGSGKEKAGAQEGGKAKRHDDIVLRTAAAACVLEATFAGWMAEEADPKAPLDQLADPLLQSLTAAAKADSAAAALPVLLTMEQLFSTEPGVDRRAAQGLVKLPGLVQHLLTWLPRGTVSGASAADSAAAAAAAEVIRSMSEQQATLLFADMEALLRHAASVHAKPALREACSAALDFAVKRESNAELLAQLFATKIGHGSDGEELGSIESLSSIAQRMVQQLRAEPGQATTALLAALDRAKKLVPKDLKESPVVLALLDEAEKIGSASLGRVKEAPSPRPDPGPPSAGTGTLPPIGQTGKK